jgi:hypothetical protein
MKSKAAIRAVRSQGFRQREKAHQNKALSLLVILIFEAFSNAGRFVDVPVCFMRQFLRQFPAVAVHGSIYL